MIYCVPYAYDRPKPNRIGGSVARCNAIINKLQRAKASQTDCTFILSAGFTKESKSQPTDTVSESIASQMAMYVQKLGYRATIPELGWGTLEETRIAVDAIPRGSRVVISTNLGHMPRVMLCWWFLSKGHHTKFVIAEHSFTYKEYLQETIKFFSYLGLLLKSRG